MRERPTKLLLLTGLLCACAVVSLAKDLPIEKVKTEYGFSSWEASRPKHGAAVTNWVPDLAALGGTNIVVYDSHDEAQDSKAATYNCEIRQKEQSGRVLIRVLERKSSTKAHEELMKTLARSAHRKQLKEITDDGEKIGDRCFAVRRDKEIRAISFFRKNLYVEVIAVTGQMDVRKIASAIDQQIIQVGQGKKNTP